jgi:hypothetical protein
VEADLENANNQEYVGIAILILVLMVSPIIILLVRNAVTTIQVTIISSSYSSSSPIFRGV